MVAYIDPTGRAVVAPNSYGECLTPSVVYFESEGNFVVGRVAKEAAGLYPDQVVSLVKREMGDREWRREFFGKEYTPQSISALILKALADDTELVTGHRVTDVVITVPAYFGLLEKDATKQAGEIAGLNVIGILPEPVTAALHYGVTGSVDDTTVLVYDLGGATFDVSLLKISATSVEVLAVGGDHRLGGTDWDEKLFDHILEQLIGQWSDESVWDDEEELQAIRTLAEQVKKDLSRVESKQVIRRYSGTAAKVTVTRRQFEEMTAELLEETIRITTRTLDEAEERYPGIRGEISHLLLVGGSSWMPAVSERLKQEFSWEPRLSEPDLAVAKGAALYAAGQTVRHVDTPEAGAQVGSGAATKAISSRGTRLSAAEPVTDAAVARVASRYGIEEEELPPLAHRRVVDVLPKAVGVKLIDTTKPGWEDDPDAAFYIEHLIPAQTQLPYQARLVANTVVPNQPDVEIEIWEQAGAQESPAMEANHQLVNSTIRGIPPLPVGSPVDITIKVDGDGRLSVTAVEPVSGKELTVEAGISVLSEEQVEEARQLYSGLTVSVDEPPPSGTSFGDDPDDAAVTDMSVPPARYLAADLPERAPAGARVSLLIRIVLAQAPSSTPSASLKPFLVPSAGTKVTISVSAPGLVALGDLEQEVLVPAHADSEQVRFGFRTGPVGLQTVTIRAFAGGTFLGELGAQMSVELGAALEEGPTRKADLGPAVAEPGEVTLQVNRDGDLYSFQLISETWYPAQLSRRLAGDPAEAVEALVAELRGMAAGRSSYASPKLVRARLRNLGAQLWADAVPETVRRQFWEQADRIGSFSVASDLDNIPWELLYPVDGHNEIGFLCEQYPLTRRVYGQGRTRRLPLSSVAYVVPQGSPDDAMDEVTRVRARLGHEISDQGILDNLQGLTALLDNARTGVLHFACHNKFTSADGSVVTMADGPFRPSDLSLAVQRKALAEFGPLIFFNGCRSAGEIPGLTRMMGWAKQFMGAGAGAFLGSLWPVRSSSARDFADAFYAAFAAEQLPLGEATRKARRAIAEEGGDPTWLAYTVYGNPAAAAIRGPQSN